METYSLIVNLGSASKKYALFLGESLLASLHSEKRAEDYLGTMMVNKVSNISPLSEADYKENLEYFLHYVQQELKLNRAVIKKVGIRIVAPGSFFSEHKKINAEYIIALTKKATLDPLHINPTLTEIQTIKRNLPDAKLIGLSDSAFHTTITPQHRIPAFNKKDVENLDLYRVGYHGISLASLVKKIPSLLNQVPKKVIICHLGGGSSVTALIDGKSIETSMGYSPLSGVVMSTRSGDVDPGALLTLMEEKRLKPQEALTYLYQESGLRGISGLTGDIPKLLTLEQEGVERASIALSLYTETIAQKIASYMVHLGNLDTLIFSGTIGERSPIIRERIISKLSFLPLQLDSKKNQMAIASTACISNQLSDIPVFTILTDETLEMASLLQYNF